MSAKKDRVVELLDRNYLLDNETVDAIRSKLDDLSDDQLSKIVEMLSRMDRKQETMIGKLAKADPDFVDGLEKTFEEALNQ